MTFGETLHFQAIAAVGVVVLVSLCWLMGFRGRARVDDLETIAALHGVRLLETVLDGKGRAGVGLMQDGKLFVVKAMGLDVAVRVLAKGEIASVRVKSDRVQLHFVDIGFPAIELNTANPPLWLGRIAR